ncbi:synaptopodin isoform X1 [Carcharodon carcharias]|uniref:synaptopodin isoform X1 n=1 Tax=Carcharodon carcharias TaxID=13397 RepID=UPI001B7EF3A9|nr:synaptopodin isoform X1 [Carcharodon carcharias]
MQVGADVHSCGFFTQAPAEPKARWYPGGNGSPPPITGCQGQENRRGNWGEEEEGTTRDVGLDKENGIVESWGPNSTFSEVAVRQLPSTLREDDCTFNILPEQCTAIKTESRGKDKCRAPKVVPPVIQGVVPHQRPASLCRSLSVSEQEAKDARIQSQRIAAQLTTPPSANSKGVLLFNKRKKRVNEFTLTSYGQQGPWSGLEVSRPVDGEGRAPGDHLARAPSEGPQGLADSPSSSEETSVPYFEQRVKGGNMEAALTVGNHDCPGALEDRTEEVEDGMSGDEREEQRSEGLAVEHGGEAEAAEEHEAPQGVINSAAKYPLETNNLVKPARTTMEVHLESSQPLRNSDHKVDKDLPREVNNQTDGVTIRESQVSYVPEEKQAFVVNRTPKPFLSEGVSPKPYKPQAGPPESSPSSPAYAHPPPVSRMTSPPPCAASSPSAVGEAARPPAMWVKKTGILEESRMHRAGRKPMFTFHEKPKVAPNPELLSLVQGIDVKKKSAQGEALTEEDYLGLGAEAATFTQQKPSPPVAPKPVVSSQVDPPVPEWASCLKPPELRAPRRSGATQTLAEVKGKGAELFARRQSRMERYTIESSPAKENQPRPPSPTMSLPPSWKCGDERRSPSPLNHRSFHLGSRSPPSAFAQVDKVKSGPRAPAGSPRHRPHQLSSSLFIISPDKSPLTSLPRGAPSPPRPVLAGTATYVRQASAPPPSCPPAAAKPPAAAAGLNGFANHSASLDLGAPSFQPAPASPSSSPSPRTREVTQAPRPSFSTRKAGLEPQQGLTSPTTSAWKPSLDRRLSSPRLYTDTFRTQAASEYRPGSPKSPFYPISPPATALFNNWSPLRETKASSPVRPGGDSMDNRRLKDLLAKNVVNAARRKKLSSPTASPTSPGDLPPTPSPRASCLSPPLPLTPSVASPDTLTQSVRTPLRPYRRSLTDSEFSLGSDDSGPRSPSYYNFCPRGWTGSKLRQSEQL